MNCRFPLILTCLSFLAISPIAASAQQPAGAPARPGTLVALVDIPKVFDMHPHFKARMDGLQQQVNSSEADFTQRQKELASRGKALENLRPDSPDYKKLEADLARKLADLKVQARQQKKQFLQQEARIYYETYQEILRVVETVARKYNIGLVLRFDSGPIDPANPQSVALGMNRPVIFQQGLDITAAVVEQLQTAVATNPRNRSPRR